MNTLRTWALVAAATLGVSAVFVTATPALAADESYTRTIPGFTFTYGGAIRAEAGTTTVTFWRNVATDHYWMTYSTKIRDRSTDGYCARANFISIGNWLEDSGYECNAVWKNYSGTFSDCTTVDCHSFGIQLGRGSSSSTEFHDLPPTGLAIRQVSARSGW